MNDSNLKRLLKRFEYGNIVYDFVFIVIALVMIFKNQEFTIIITRILGAITIYDGILRVTTYYKLKDLGLNAYSYNLNFGIISILIGLFLIVFSKLFVNFFRVLLGLYIIYNAVMSTSFVLDLRKFAPNEYLIELILSIVLGIIGIVILINPGSIIRAIGYILLVYAIISLVQSITYIMSIRKL